MLSDLNLCCTALPGVSWEEGFAWVKDVSAHVTLHLRHKAIYSLAEGLGEYLVDCGTHFAFFFSNPLCSELQSDTL